VTTAVVEREIREEETDEIAAVQQGESGPVGLKRD
jgi:hypothetical protein